MLGTCSSVRLHPERHRQGKLVLDWCTSQHTTILRDSRYLVMSELPEFPATISWPAKYVGEDEAPVSLANHFIIQYHQGLFILSLAQGIPPILLGTPEEQQEQAREIEFVPIRIISRVALTEERVHALMGLLQGHLDRFASTSTGEGSADQI